VQIANAPTQDHEAQRQEMDDTPAKRTTASSNQKAVVPQRRAAGAELVREGKYDAAGRRVPPLRIALPF